MIKENSIEISKCYGEGCHFKENCHRYSADSKEVEYLFITPYEEDKCDYQITKSVDYETVNDSSD